MGSSSQTAEQHKMIPSEEVRTPFVWNKPKTKIYDYNQEFGGMYYQPMLDYVDTKERQGIYFERPSERIHLPEPAELALCELGCGSQCYGATALDTALERGYSNMARQTHAMTVRTQNLILRGSKDNTILDSRPSSAMLRDKYIKELHLSKARSHHA